MAPLSRDPRSLHIPAAAAVPVAVHTTAAPIRTLEPEAPQPQRKRRRRWPWIVVFVAIVFALAVMALAITTWGTWNEVERVNFDGGLAGGGTGTNYLVVGTDSRAGVNPDGADAGYIFGEGISGERTDTIAILRVEAGEVSLLAIPRDLYVPIDGGNRRRINAAFGSGGPQALVKTVQAELGIGIDHYLEVDLAGFLGLVDALGGVTIDFPHPATDDRSGLNITERGPQNLNSNQALAYVRSRRYSELIDGQTVTDPTSDLGRVKRQQVFIGAVMDKLGSTSNPFTLVSVMRGVSDDLRVDEGMSPTDVISLALAFRGATPTAATIPTKRYITDGGADVLLPADDAPSVLAPFQQ